MVNTNKQTKKLTPKTKINKTKQIKIYKNKLLIQTQHKNNKKTK